MVLLMIVYSRRQAPPFAPVRPVELNRDNIRPYDIEGGGEADNDQYDINGLRKPVMPLEGNGLGGFAQSVYPPQRTAPGWSCWNCLGILKMFIYCIFFHITSKSLFR